MKSKLIVGVLVVFGVFVTIFAGILYTLRLETNLGSAGVEANRLITSLGGPSKICEEANRMFKHFGTSNEKFLNHADLKDYPAIAALGTAHVILPGSPPHLSIRVGTHLNGFFIEIADTNNPDRYPTSPSTLVLAGECIFVHR
jgi:hypothetical protein